MLGRRFLLSTYNVGPFKLQHALFSEISNHFEVESLAPITAEEARVLPRGEMT